MLRINDEAPNLAAETTLGPIHFHQWIGDGRVILFPHPKNFTPVCTTELGYMAGLEPEFTKRNCKIIGLSVDSVSSHGKWVTDIEETQATPVNWKYGDDVIILTSVSDEEAQTEVPRRLEIAPALPAYGCPAELVTSRFPS